MPSSQGFDPSSVRERLRSWLALQMPDAEDVEVSNLDAPSATGHSGETVLFDVSWTEAGPRTTSRWCCAPPRAATPCSHLRPGRAVRRHDPSRRATVPLPPLRYHESDPDVLGGSSS